ncbi:MAG: threonine aldolase, partial [Planctomycetota bacterium]
PRIQEDHDNAAKLAQGIARLDGLTIDVSRVRTNILYFDVTGDGLTAEALVATLAAQGVRMLCIGPGRIRAVTHYGITTEDIDTALSIMATVMQAP